MKYAKKYAKYAKIYAKYKQICKNVAECENMQKCKK